MTAPSLLCPPLARWAIPRAATAVVPRWIRKRVSSTSRYPFKSKQLFQNKVHNTKCRVALSAAPFCPTSYQMHWAVTCELIYVVCAIRAGSPGKFSANDNPHCLVRFSPKNKQWQVNSSIGSSRFDALSLHSEFAQIEVIDSGGRISCLVSKEIVWSCLTHPYSDPVAHSSALRSPESEPSNGRRDVAPLRCRHQIEVTESHIRSLHSRCLGRNEETEHHRMVRNERHTKFRIWWGKVFKQPPLKPIMCSSGDFSNFWDSQLEQNSTGMCRWEWVTRIVGIQKRHSKSMTEQSVSMPQSTRF